MKRFAIVACLLWSINSAATPSQQGPSKSLERARALWFKGDKTGVLPILEQYQRNKPSSDGNLNDAIYFLLAMGHQHAGNHAQAEEVWRKIWSKGRALKKRSYYQAAINAYDGNFPEKTITYCNKLQSSWPKDNLSSECILLKAKAYMKVAKWRKAYQEINRYLNQNPKTPREEVLQLSKRQAKWEMDPINGKEQLRSLYLNHSYATTDKEISNILKTTPPHWLTLKEAGEWAWTLQKTGHFDASWDIVQTLQILSKQSTIAKDWLKKNYASLAWKNRRYKEYVAHHLKNYKANPTPQIAWRIFRGYVKGGDWKNASRWGEKSARKHANSSRWRDSKETRARVEMYQKEYRKAGRIWNQMKSRKGTFYTGFSAYMAGDHKKALTILKSLDGKKDKWNKMAKYWSGRTHLKLKKYQQAQSDFDYVLRRDSVGWYSLLIKNLEWENEGDLGVMHNGQWQGPRPNLRPNTKNNKLNTTTSEQSALASNFTNPVGNIDWENFTFETQSKDGITDATPMESRLNEDHLLHQQLSVVDTYQTEKYGSTQENGRLLKELALKHRNTFPELFEAHDLAQAGQYPEAAQTLEGFYYLWKNAKRFRAKDSRSVQLRRLSIQESDWTRYFVFVRCHHQVYRRTFRVASSLQNKRHKKEVKKLNHPLPRQPEVLNLAQKYDFDPYLFWGLLRQESSYREFVKSHVGAIGYVQVMPNTGARIADILNAKQYTPQDLENPAINLKYGAFYFSKLMERFGNAFPFAVGSYNGGPHNMSRWYQELNGHVEMDEFIEHIAFKETRGYIKKVTGHYARYLDLYGHPDAKIFISKAPIKDDYSVIDF